MRRFYLARKEDVTGVSGTGRVADGVEFENGVVCLTWKSQFQSVTMLPSISLIEKVYTHLGQHDTKIMFVDEMHEDIEDKAAKLAVQEAERATAAAAETNGTEEKKKAKPRKKAAKSTKKGD